MIGSRLRAILKEKKISQAQFARMMGVDPTRVSEWINDKVSPRLETLKKIEAELKVSSNELLPKTPDNVINLPAEDFNIPIYTTIKAGNGEMGITDGEVNGFISICSEYQKQKIFAIQVSGDSMATELHDGDIALFKPINGEPIREKDIFAVEIEGWSSWVVKFVRQDPSGVVQLISANPAYPVKEIDPKVSPVTLRGRLIESRRIRK